MAKRKTKTAPEPKPAVVWNPPRARRKHAPTPWPTAAERTWKIDRHTFAWELPDAAYDSLRAWVARVEAGEPEALDMAKTLEASVVHRRPAGQRDVLIDPDLVLNFIADGCFDTINDLPDNPTADDMSEEGYARRQAVIEEVAGEVIAQIFGPDPTEDVFMILWSSHENQGEPCYDLLSQSERARSRLANGVANARDLEIDALGEEYWH